MLVAAFQSDQGQGKLDLGLPQHAGQQLDGVAAALIDVEAGMPAFQPADLQAESGLDLGGLAGQGQGDIRIGASSAADGESAFLLAIQVEEIFSL